MTLSFDTFRKGVRCDLLGVPPMDCFDALPPNEHPRSLFPDTSCAAAAPNRMTAACTRACLARLEDGGRIATHYRSAFRRRAPWGFDVFEA